MTRKDFALIASVLLNDRPFADGASYSGMTDWERGASDEWHTTTLAMATALATTNPQFDRARFLKACGVSS